MKAYSTFIWVSGVLCLQYSHSLNTNIAFVINIFVLLNGFILYDLV